MKFFSDKSKIKAVHDADLKGYLESLGIYEDIVQGRRRCAYCGNIITPDSIGAVVPSGENILLVCLNVKCQDRIYNPEH